MMRGCGASGEFAPGGFRVVPVTSGATHFQAGGTTVNSALRIGIAGCGRAARVHLERLLALDGVSIVGCADSDRASAESMAQKITERSQSAPTIVFDDHRELLRRLHPDALFIFTPHVSHYRLAMDALQAGCHVFVEKPLSTNLQEAADIVGLARGRGLKVAVGHQYRLCPSLAEARRLLDQRALGPLVMVTATLAQPWLARQVGPENDWRYDRKVAGGGILADTGDHLIDTLLWTTRLAAREVYAIQSCLDSGLDTVTAAAIRLGDDTPASLAVSGLSPGLTFELNYFGAGACLRATDSTLEKMEFMESTRHPLTLPEPGLSIDADFVAAVLGDDQPACPAEQALETVRLLEAVGRSAATGKAVRIS
jgi:predicted dehydrogenase